MPPPIDHVIVLVLENRSFDHMLGFLQHPDPRFNGLTTGGPYTNPCWHRPWRTVAATADAKLVLPVDPDHSHEAVMRQLRFKGRGDKRRPTNQGFVASYEEKGRGLTPPRFEGLLGPIVNWSIRHRPFKKRIKNRGELVMRCQPPEQVPVLKELALKFGVCSMWFSSVPGETWPNRNFMHAATSDGKTDNDFHFYNDCTIFELLESRGKHWHIYHEDTPQAWAFRWLLHRDHHWFTFSEFEDHVKRGEVPHYSFIEPNHRPPTHRFHLWPDERDRSNSQHPGNNLVPNEKYDSYGEDDTDVREVKGDFERREVKGDFERGEQLIATVYEALRSNPAVFERSVLLITYDEHGGFYDHEPPPNACPPGDPVSHGRLERFMDWLLRKKGKAFDFTVLGPRVPALVVSPYVPAGTVCDRVRDHASIPATLRELFAPDADPLTERDRYAPPFHSLLTLDRPRAGTDLPDLSKWKQKIPAEAIAPGPEAPPPDFYRPFYGQAELVGRELNIEPPAGLGPRARARHVTAEFAARANDARAARGSSPPL